MRAYNLNPGFIHTERMELHVAAQEGLDLRLAAPPEVCGAVGAWLAEDPADPPRNGTLVDSQSFCREHQLIWLIFLHFVEPCEQAAASPFV